MNKVHCLFRKIQKTNIRKTDETRYTAEWNHNECFRFHYYSNKEGYPVIYEPIDGHWAFLTYSWFKSQYRLIILAVSY